MNVSMEVCQGIQVGKAHPTRHLGPQRPEPDFDLVEPGSMPRCEDKTIPVRRFAQKRHPSSNRLEDFSNPLFFRDRLRSRNLPPRNERTIRYFVCSGYDALLQHFGSWRKALTANCHSSHFSGYHNLVASPHQKNSLGTPWFVFLL